MITLCKFVSVVLFSSLFVQTTTAGERRETARELVVAANEAYADEDYERSMQLYARALDLGRIDSAIAYNAACSAALNGDNESAFRFLERAMGLGWEDVAHLRQDADLQSLHAEPEWEPMIARFETELKAMKSRWNGGAFQTRFQEDLSPAEKAAGLSKLWAEVKFNFVNFHQVPDLDWDAEYMACLQGALNTKSTLEYYRLLEALVAKLKDGHTNVYLPEALNLAYNARPGFRTRLIENKIIVVEILDSSATEAGLSVGQEVLRVDGLDV